MVNLNLNIIQYKSRKSLGFRVFAFVTLYLLLFASSSFAQVEAFANMDTNQIRIGEQTKIELYVKYNVNQKKLNIQWPVVGDTLRKEIDVVSVSKIDTTIPDKNKPEEIQQHQTITVTSADSGFWAIAPFIFIVNNDTAKPVKTDALLLAVYTIPVDTAEKTIKDIKAPFDEPSDWHEYLPYIYGAAIALVILIIVI